jgi:hypothetical protein
LDLFADPTIHIILVNFISEKLRFYAVNCKIPAAGCDSQHIPGDSGIFITRIKPGGAAEVDGRLHVGDRIVSVRKLQIDHQLLKSIIK